MEEIWKPIKNLAGYEVSDLGNIRKDGEKVKCEVFTQPGYLPKNVFYPIVDNEVRKFPSHVEAAVAFTFLGEPIDFYHRYIIHIDGDRLNDRLDNLRWGSESERQKLYHKLGVWKSNPYFRNINTRTVKEIFILSHTKGMKLSEIAKKFHCSVSDVRAIKKGEKWNTVTKNLIKEI